MWRRSTFPVLCDSTLSSVDATVINHMMQHAQRIRENSHL